MSRIVLFSPQSEIETFPQTKIWICVSRNVLSAAYGENSSSPFTMQRMYGSISGYDSTFYPPQPCVSSSSLVSTLCAISNKCAPIQVVSQIEGGAGTQVKGELLGPLNSCCRGAMCVRGKRRIEQRCSCQCPRGFMGTECTGRVSQINTIFYHIDAPSSVYFPSEEEENIKKHLSNVLDVPFVDVYVNRVFRSSDCKHGGAEVTAMEVRMVVRVALQQDSVLKSEYWSAEYAAAQQLINRQLDANASGALLAHKLRLSCDATKAPGEFVPAGDYCDMSFTCCSRTLSPGSKPCCAVCLSRITTAALPPETTPVPRKESYPSFSGDDLENVSIIVAVIVLVFLGGALLYFCSKWRAARLRSFTKIRRDLWDCCCCCCITMAPRVRNAAKRLKAISDKKKDICTAHVEPIPEFSVQWRSRRKLDLDKALKEAFPDDPYRVEEGIRAIHATLEDAKNMSALELKSAAPTYFLHDETLGMFTQEQKNLSAMLQVAK